MTSSTVAVASRILSLTSATSRGQGGTYTRSLRCPHRKKSHGVISDDRGGHFTKYLSPSVARPIHRWGSPVFKYACALAEYTNFQSFSSKWHVYDVCILCSSCAINNLKCSPTLCTRCTRKIFTLSYIPVSSSQLLRQRNALKLRNVEQHKLYFWQQ
jgi:hypothetical protein